MLREIDDRVEVQALFANIKARLPRLEALLAEASGEACEDGVYRFYHQSFKVFGLQGVTVQMVEALQALAPERELCDWFRQIIVEGTGKTFQQEDNDHWLQSARPIVEAFFHARYFLELVVMQGRELDAPPTLLPSGWAAVLCLYGLR